MASYLEEKTRALEYIHLLQAKLMHDPQTYDQFSETLIQFRRQNIPSSTAVATVQKLLHSHPDLLRAFEPFVPSNHSSAAVIIAAVEKESDVEASVDFLSRVCTRFAGCGVYRKFLDIMRTYSQEGSTVSEVCDEVSRLFGEHRDLVAEFRSFLPESYVQRSCKKRKVDRGEGSNLRQQTKKKRCTNSRRKKQRTVSSNPTIDFVMEDSLFEVDVKIGNLKATYEKAVKLMLRLSDGHLSPADVSLNEHFTPLNLACIRGLYRKPVDNAEIPGCGMVELINKLLKKKDGLEKSRERIVEKWNNIRQSRH